MPYLLNIVYACLVLLLSPWLIFSAVRKGKYRAGWRQKWLGDVPHRNGDAPCAWFHAVSVGEVNLLGPVIAAFRRAHPSWDIAVSATSRTGYELARTKYADGTVFYCPLDFSWAVKRALRRLRPQLLVLAELELWPNLVMLAHNSGVKIAIVNARLGEKSFRGYRWLRPLVARVLRCVDRITAQNESYAARFIALGAPRDRVCVTGSVKFDGAETNRANPRTQSLAQLAGIQPTDIVFLAGSTQSPEESLALETYRALRDDHPELRLILVPRHAERFEEVAQLVARSGLPWQRRSELNGDCLPSAARILLVDVIGELGAWWGTAQIGFVGGSLHNRRGGQNMIEPAAYGVATCYGPNTWNFRDVTGQLHSQAASVVVSSGDDLTTFVAGMLKNPAARAALGSRAHAYVRGQLGATARTLAALGPLACKSTTASPRVAA